MNTPQVNPVAWFEIYVQDMARAKAFYEAVLDTQLTHLPTPEGDWEGGLEMWAFPMAEEGSGAAGSLCKMEGCASGGSGTLVYFKCDDCAVEAARAASHGGSLFKEKMAIGEHGFIALVFDSEGNMIGLHSMQ
ncbi:MAG: VOC family protein [Thiotrichales bacterium]